MRRVLWTLGVSFAGFFVGGKLGSFWGAVSGALFGATIGYGFGTIFSQRHPTKSLVVYWTATLSLIGPLFGVLIEAILEPYVSKAQLLVAGAGGALAGALLGLFAGTIHLKHLRQRAHISQSNGVM
jgi:hypothetical protein